MKLLRGAIPSPRHRLAAAIPHRITGVTPGQFLWKPCQLSYWGNETDGDCVSAEEAFAKACDNPEIFITQPNLVAWAQKHGLLNGAMLSDVLTLMETDGIPQDGKVYDDGPHVSVDWTNASILNNAIAQGPVKIGVAAAQLESAWNSLNDPSGDDPLAIPQNGWFATGFASDANEDHCVSLCGFGPMGWLASELGVVSKPFGLPAGAGLLASPGYALFTWSSIGIIDVPSMLAITSEAWLRNPTTVIKS